MRHAEARREVESAPLAYLAFDPDAPAHQLDQPRGDGQPQPCTSKAAGHGAVGLGECAEDETLFIGRDARSRVGHGKVQAELPLGYRLPPTFRTTSPRSVNLMALPSRLVRTWLRRKASPTTPSGVPGRTCRASSNSFRCPADRTP